MASITSGAASLFKVIAPFAALLKSAPHRDATHIPYAQWLSLYVEALGQSPQHPTIPDEKKGEKTLFLEQYRDVVDAMLLSSLIAPRWNQVLVPTNLDELEKMIPIQKDNSKRTEKNKGHVPLETTHSDLWYVNARNCGIASSSLVSADRFYDVEGKEGEILEVFTPKFLTEPLLGGSCLANCTEELRRQGALLRASKEDSPELVGEKVRVDNNAISPSEEPTIHLTIPFSCLWQIKLEAHLRSGSLAATNTSLQERCARQSLLQNIHHAFQLQADLNCLPSLPTAQPLRIKLHVSNPTEEFDMICQLPHVRGILTTLGNASPNPPTEAKRGNLSLAALCEQNAVRLAYFMRYSLYRAHINRENAKKTGKTKPNDKKTSDELPNALVMVVHPSEQRLFRGLDVPMLRSCSSANSIRHHRSLKEANSSSTHKKAMVKCGEMVRRMIAREENLWQSTLK